MDREYSVLKEQGDGVNSHGAQRYDEKEGAWRRIKNVFSDWLFLVRSAD